MTEAEFKRQMREEGITDNMTLTQMWVLYRSGIDPKKVLSLEPLEASKDDIFFSPPRVGARPLGMIFPGEKKHRVLNAFGKPLPEPEQGDIATVVTHLRNMGAAKQVGIVLFHNIDVNDDSEVSFLQGSYDAVLRAIQQEPPGELLDDIMGWQAVSFRDPSRPLDNDTDATSYQALQDPQFSLNVFGSEQPGTPDHRLGYRVRGSPRFTATDYADPFFKPSTNYIHNVSSSMRMWPVYTRISIAHAMQELGYDPTSEETYSTFQRILMEFVEPDYWVYNVWLETHSNVSEEDLGSAKFVAATVLAQLNEVCVNHSDVMFVGLLVDRPHFKTYAGIPERIKHEPHVAQSLRMFSFPCVPYFSNDEKERMKGAITLEVRQRVEELTRVRSQKTFTRPRPPLADAEQILTDNIYPMKMWSSWNDPVWNRRNSARIVWRESVKPYLEFLFDRYNLTKTPCIFMVRPYSMNTELISPIDPLCWFGDNVVDGKVYRLDFRPPDPSDDVLKQMDNGLDYDDAMLKIVPQQLAIIEAKKTAKLDPRTLFVDFLLKQDTLLEPTSTEQLLGLNVPEFTSSPLSLGTVARQLEQGYSPKNIPDRYLMRFGNKRYRTRSEQDRRARIFAVENPPPTMKEQLRNSVIERLALLQLSPSRQYNEETTMSLQRTLLTPRHYNLRPYDAVVNSPDRFAEDMRRYEQGIAQLRPKRLDFGQPISTVIDPERDVFPRTTGVNAVPVGSSSASESPELDPAVIQMMENMKRARERQQQRVAAQFPSSIEELKQEIKTEQPYVDWRGNEWKNGEPVTPPPQKKQLLEGQNLSQPAGSITTEEFFAREERNQGYRTKLTFDSRGNVLSATSEPYIPKTPVRGFQRSIIKTSNIDPRVERKSMSAALQTMDDDDERIKQIREARRVNMLTQPLGLASTLQEEKRIFETARRDAVLGSILRSQPRISQGLFAVELGEKEFVAEPLHPFELRAGIHNDGFFVGRHLTESEPPLNITPPRKLAKPVKTTLQMSETPQKRDEKRRMLVLAAKYIDIQGKSDEELKAMGLENLLTLTPEERESAAALYYAYRQDMAREAQLFAPGQLSSIEELRAMGAYTSPEKPPDEEIDDS